MSKENAATGTRSAHLGLGTNLGDRRQNLTDAVRLLTQCGSVGLCGVARIYETSPIGGPPGQTDYYNTVIAVASKFEAPTLLSHILGVERSMGRVRNGVNGPRNIDIDLLVMGDEVFDSPQLSLPHPRFHLRRFVLAPLAELAPDLRHPLLNKSVRELLDELPEAGGKVRPIASSNWWNEPSAGQSMRLD
jgi:2-amino-4-hydroxy-6-hydroxymethyldihydropteridine diphosphokinase